MYSNSPLAAIAAFVCSVILLLGCNDDDDPNAGTLAVTFANYDFNTEQYWIVVSSADGQEVLDAHRTSENGRIEFEELPDRVSLSFVRVELSNTVFIESYVDVRPQEWIRRGSSEDEELGTTQITAVFPQGNYHELTLQTPSGSWLRLNQPPDSIVLGPSPEVRLEDGTMTMLGIIEGETSGWAGWLIQKPFVQNALNEYRLQLDHPLAYHMMTLSKFAQHVDLDGYRGVQDTIRFRLDSDADQITENEYRLNLPEFPVNYYWLSAHGPNYGFWKKFSVLPSTLEIPDGFVTAEYDEERAAYHQLAVTGNADALFGGWQVLASERSFAWVVYAATNAMEIKRPAFPDSVLSALQVTDSELQPTALGLLDFHPTSSWNAFVTMETQVSGTPFPYGDQLYQFISEELTTQSIEPFRDVLRAQRLQ